MRFFASNLKFLRHRRQITQEQVAKELGIIRSTYSGYENAIAEPGLQTLVMLSKFYQVQVDDLLNFDFSTGQQPDPRDPNRMRVLVTTVSDDNEENIELVSERAAAGYAAGYADPEFITRLPVFRLPFLSADKKYRSFRISGDSMLPIPDGSYVTAEFVENFATVKDNTLCIVVTYDDGIVFKRVMNNLQESKTFRLHSLNPIYAPYDVRVENIAEVWKFVNFISDKIPEMPGAETEALHMLRNLQSEIRQLKEAQGLN